jgi:cytochrome b561
MRVLFFIQIALGIWKVWFAFSPAGSRRRAWHLCSGLAIMAMGIVLVSERSIR